MNAPKSSQRVVFRLDGASPAPELFSLFQLEQAVADAPELALELSRLTTARLRARFPAGAPDVRTVRTDAGLSLDVDVSDVFAATVFVGWLQESADFEAFLLLAREGARVVDVGANFGLYAIHAAARIGTAGRVDAYEPAPGAFALLARNVAQNEFGGRVVAHAAAAAAETGEALFRVAADVSFSGIHDTGRSATREQIIVRTVALDDEPHLAAPAQIDMMKIDVEGAEADVLQGARALLARSARAIVQFEVSHKNLTEARVRALDEVLAALRAQGFTLWARDEAGGPRALVALPDRANGNFFLAHGAAAEKRLIRALEQTRRVVAPRDPAARAMLERIRAQAEALGEADVLRAKVEKVGRATIGEGEGEGPFDMLDRVQASWFELRQFRAHAEARAENLADTVENFERWGADAEAKLVARAEANARLSDRVGAQDDAITQLRAKVDTLRDALTQAQARIIAHNSEADVLRAKIEKVGKATIGEGEGADPIDMLDRVQASWFELRQFRAHAEARAENLADTLENFERWGADAEAKLVARAEANARLSDRVGAQDDAITQLKAKVDTLRNALTQAQAQIAARNSEVETLRAKVSQLADVRDALNVRQAEFNAEIAAVRKELAATQEQVKERGSEADSFQRRADHLTKLADTLHTKHTETGAALAKREAELARVQSHLGTRETELAAARETAARLAQAQAKLASELEKAESEIAARRSESTRLAEALADAQARLEKSQVETQEEVRQRAEANARIAALEAEQTRLAAFLRARELALSQARDDIARQMGELESRDAANAALEAELVACVEALGAARAEGERRQGLIVSVLEHFRWARWLLPPGLRNL